LQLSHYIDHTLLKADAQQPQIESLCREAQEYGFFSVCVNSANVAKCAKILAGTKVKVCSVVGFPLGAMDTKAKAFETSAALQNGATEIDMVLNIGALKDMQFAEVLNDIRAVVDAAQGHIVKVIIETSLLSESEKIKACELAVEAGAHFVKTCTGFGGGGATIQDVRLMKAAVGSKAEVKASGGIKDETQARALIAAGATRLGTSSGITIVNGGSVQGGY
jgi:deoxyribose-phosphate aldolase